MNHFLFLYPIPEIISCEIERGAYAFRDQSRDVVFLKRLGNATSDEERESIKQEARQEIQSEFRGVYRNRLNACIDERYRKNGFTIHYALFNGSLLSDVIELQQSDRIIEVGLDFKTHTTRQPNGEYLYPDPDYILNRLNKTRVIRIAGFHMWDCVERLARRAYERGLETLVDEDLTEFFTGRLSDPDFKIGTYPTYNARKKQGPLFEMFLEVRKERPWLWQEY